MDHQHRFSGRQISTMVVAACIAIVLAPVGVFAASRSVFTLSDAKHPSYRAQVTKSGQQVITGSVTGTVAAMPSAPGKPFSATGTDGANNSQVIAVPAGRHLNVQVISAQVLVPGGAHVIGDFQYFTNGKVYRLYLPMTYGLTNAVGEDDYTTTQQVTVDADPGSTITFYPVPSAAGTPIVSLTVSGYLT
jgi:hypothetical protein